MNDKKVIAQYLYDLAKQSKSEFIEVAQDSELIDIAKKMNLVIPSPDIAILKTIYAETGVPNRNHVVLPKSAVEKGLPTIIGKQANWSHKGANYICGWILDAKLEGDLIVIYVAIFKSLFIDEFDVVKKMFEDNNLSVSFEIWNRNSENGKSVLHDLENGNYSIDPIIFHGVGILIGDEEKPACPKAYALKLLAKFNIDKLITEETDKSSVDYLVYAHTEEPKCSNCGTCKCDSKKEEKIMVKCEKCGKEFEPTADEKICVDCASLPKEDAIKKAEEIIPETKIEEIKVEAETKLEEVVKTIPEEVKVEAEVKPEVVEEVVKEEVKVEDASTVIVNQEKTVVDEIKPEGETITTVEKIDVKTVDDSGKVIHNEETEIKTVVTYTREQLEEKVQEAKVELQKLVEEKDTEIEKLKQELEVAKQPKEIVKAKEEDNTLPNLTVGEIITTGEDSEIKRQKDNVNAFIASKHKK